MAGKPGPVVGGGRHVDMLHVGSRSMRLAWKSGEMVLVAVACLCRGLAQLRPVEAGLQWEGCEVLGTAKIAAADPAARSRPDSYGQARGDRRSRQRLEARNIVARPMRRRLLK